jgi:hypothetical protein
MASPMTAEKQIQIVFRATVRPRRGQKKSTLREYVLLWFQQLQQKIKEKSAPLFIVKVNRPKNTHRWTVPGTYVVR